MYKVHWNSWTKKWHFLWKHFVTQLYRLKQTADGASARSQKTNKNQNITIFKKRKKLKIICDFSTFFNTVRFDPLEEWLFRIRVGNLLLFRLKLRKFPKIFELLNSYSNTYLSWNVFLFFLGWGNSLLNYTGNMLPCKLFFSNTHWNCWMGTYLLRTWTDFLITQTCCLCVYSDLYKCDEF